jgi:tripartite-type tricarboxylate transporter receptor subunit TctC
VPAQPGGGLDLIGRTFADQLGRSMGQSFVVENISGGGGTIASQTVARSAPDGYTLMVDMSARTAPTRRYARFRTTRVRDFTADRDGRRLRRMCSWYSRRCPVADVAA